MSALPQPTLRRLPVAAGVAACASLGAALAVGPGGSAIPTIAFAAVALALLLAETGRRALQLVRSGFGAYLLIGALVTGLVGAGWSIVVAFHAEDAALTLLFGAVGAGLIAMSVIEARSRMGGGATPWQALTGGPTGAAAANRALRTLGPLLLGAFLLVLALRFAATVVVEIATFTIDRAGGFTLLVVGSCLGAVVLTTLVLAVRPRRLGLGRDRPGGARPAPATTRDEQVVAAHLHDSVLQTLALIQRSNHDPARVAQLARQQERSLRSWLAGRDEHAASTLAGALRVAAREVEDEEPGAIIEVVVVGDAPLDRGADAMVRAAREAMRNAVRHAGSPVRVFLEVEDDLRELFVRDTGPGFDLGEVGDERRGVRDAIIGRMEHVGGTAEIDTSPAGTEVGLTWRAPKGDA